mmetsp:Transcript_17749/g.30058  ORF Transcript_17749/g.30058 Transcript_17749/m.30058 type:complete len:110 (-) Transcript_17749:510-839(-)
MIEAMTPRDRVNVITNPYERNPPSAANCIFDSPSSFSSHSKLTPPKQRHLLQAPRKQQNPGRDLENLQNFEDASEFEVSGGRYLDCDSSLQFHADPSTIAHLQNSINRV